MEYDKNLRLSISSHGLILNSFALALLFFCSLGLYWGFMSTPFVQGMHREFDRQLCSMQYYTVFSMYLIKLGAQSNRIKVE